jgi:RNA polymerase sigma factor (sigma-70 family)
VKYIKIIKAFQTDLNQGLKILFEEYGQKLFGFSITHFHLDEDEGYDVLYKTMETVGKVVSRYEFNSENHFANWILKIHKNNILQLLRTKKSKEHNLQIVDFSNWEIEAKEFEDEELELDSYKTVLEQISSINTFENSSSQSKLMFAMQKALQQISDIDRELLLLRMNNYSYDEIAEMLGIENNQLKVKFNRAKAKVERKTLEILKESDNETR